MQNPIHRRFAVASLLVSCAVSGAFAACKSNSISQTNNASYDSSITVTVDAKGAKVIGPDGAEADIPAGALDSATDVTIGKLHGGYPPFPPGWVPASPITAGAPPATGFVYSFEPHAETFKKTIDLRVPYVDPGKAVRLAVAEPNVGWTTIDGADFAGGFAHTTSTHFSFYAVVSGAPVDPTLDAGRDATPDAEADAAVDAAMEAGPPPSPALFAATPLRDAILRFELTPSVVVDGGVADAGDAGPVADAGVTGDGGAWNAPGSSALAMSAQLSLFTSTHQWARDGGTLVLDGGAPIAIDAGLATLSNPFGAPSLGASITVDTPGVMTFANGELWLSVGDPADIETYTGSTRTWSGAGAGMTTGAAGYGGIAYDPATHTVFLSVRGPDAVQRWSISGSGAAKNAVKVLADLTTNVASPSGLAFTPWGELLVVTSAGIARFDSNGTAKGIYTSAALGITPSRTVAVVRWPGGADELFVFDGARTEIARFAFVDGSHDAAVKVGAVATGNEVTALVIAP